MAKMCIRDRYRTDNETETVEFVQQMGYQQGLYLEDSIISLDEICLLYTSRCV